MKQKYCNKKNSYKSFKTIWKLWKYIETLTANDSSKCHIKPRTHESVFCHQSLMEMSETDVKTDRPYTRHSKVSVTGYPLYTSAEISTLLCLVGGGGAVCSLKYEREANTFLKT